MTIHDTDPYRIKHNILKTLESVAREYNLEINFSSYLSETFRGTAFSLKDPNFPHPLNNNYGIGVIMNFEIDPKGPPIKVRVEAYHQPMNQYLEHDEIEGIRGNYYSFFVDLANHPELVIH